MPTPDSNTPAPERKTTEIKDLPAKDSTDEANDVKGGATSTIIPCFRVPRVIDPCWRPGGVI